LRMGKKAFSSRRRTTRPAPRIIHLSAFPESWIQYHRGWLFFQLEKAPALKYKYSMDRLRGIRKNENLIWLIFAAALALRLWKLGGQSFWADEALTIGMYKSPPQGISYFRKFLWDVHGPLYSLILHFWSMISSSEYWLRLPSAFSGALAVPFMYWWLRRIIDERTAIIGGLFLAISPFSLYYSQELRFYSPLLLFSILALIAFARFERKPGRKNALILGMVLGVTCLFHLSGLFLSAGLAVYLVLTEGLKGRKIRYGGMALLISLLILSPWIYRQIMFLSGINIESITGMAPSERLRGELTLNLWSYPYTIYAFSAGYSFGPGLRELHGIRSGLELISDYGIEIISLLLIFGGVILNGFFELRKTKVKLMFAVLPVIAVLAITVAALLNVKVFNVRYLMPVFPVFIGLLASGIPQSRFPAIILTSAICIFMLISDINYFTKPEYFRDDIRGAVKVIEDNEIPGDSIILQGVGSSFGVYYDGKNNDRIMYLSAGESEKAAERLRIIIEERGRIWNMRARGWEKSIDDRVYRLLSVRMKKVGEWTLPGAKVYLFERTKE